MPTAYASPRRVSFPHSTARRAGGSPAPTTFSARQQQTDQRAYPAPREPHLPTKTATPLRPMRSNESVSGSADPTHFASVRPAATSSIPPDEAEERAADSLGATRYAVVCKRLFVQPDPCFFRVLNGEHDGTYTTRAAEVVLDPDGIFAIASTLEYCRGLHTLQLVGLHRGGRAMLTREVLAAVVGVVRATATIKILDLSHDALTDDIAAAPLNKLLTQNTNLTGLMLGGNGLALGTARVLLANLPVNRSLHELGGARCSDLCDLGLLFVLSSPCTLSSPRVRPTVATRYLRQPGDQVAGSGTRVREAVQGECAHRQFWRIAARADGDGAPRRLCARAWPHAPDQLDTCAAPSVARQPTLFRAHIEAVRPDRSGPDVLVRRGQGRRPPGEGVAHQPIPDPPLPGAQWRRRHGWRRRCRGALYQPDE